MGLSWYVHCTYSFPFHLIDEKLDKIIQMNPFSLLVLNLVNICHRSKLSYTRMTSQVYGFVDIHPPS